MDAKYGASTIAKWFVAWAETDESGEANVSNLKLQKLLYYAQGNHLALMGVPLFRDPVEAWDHGPVVADVYHGFKSFDSGVLHLAADDPFEWTDVDDVTTQFLLDVWDTYGGIAAWKLRNMTHSESPWVDTYRQGARNAVISDESMERYFKSLL
jgi:uncharacterized phage-associated protein